MSRKHVAQRLRQGGVIPVLVLAAATVATGSALTFTPRDPVIVASETADASHVQRREISHFHDAWDAIWEKGDGAGERALDVNTADEVPDSSWFENRIGTRPMTIAEIAAGPNRQPPSGAWTITAGKNEGVTPGLTMKDSTGQRYFVKFDPIDYPELGTGAEMISTKLLYAAGYHVPENFLVVFARADLRIAPEATIREGDGRQRPLTERDVDQLLSRVARRADGRYRALASKQLAGTSLGPFSYYGVRPDDPNDAIPHEHRRSLRALRVFAAWINHVDVKSENSLDTLLDTEDGRRTVRHHLIDFNATLGSAGIGPADRRSGYEYIFDSRQILLSLATLGLYVRPWLTIQYPDVSAVGRFEGDRFEPARWKPTFPNRAMLNARPDDTFWAARRVMAFSDDAIRAVVATAEYTDPRAAPLIADALMKRRDKIGQAWLTAVNPLVDFAIAGGDAPLPHSAPTLTFRNAAADDRLSAQAVEYHVQWFRFDNAGGTRTPVNPLMAAAEPRLPIPNELRDAEFIAADVSAMADAHPAWRRPARIVFRRVDDGWTLVGVVRLETTRRAQ